MRAELRLLPPCRGRLAATLGCLTIAAALESIGLSLFVPLIMRLANGSASMAPGGSGFFTSYVQFLEGVSKHHGVLIVVAALCGALVLKNLFGYAGRLLGVSIELRTVRTLRTRLFETYLGMDYQFFLNHRHGHLIHNLFGETAVVGEMVEMCIMSLSNVITIAALYGLLLLISWQATLAASGIFALLTLGLQGLAGLSKRVGTMRQRIVKEFVSLGTELILGIRQVKIFSTESAVAARFRSAAQELSQANLRVHAISLSVEPLSELVALLVMVSLIMLATKGLIGAAAAPVSVLITFAVVLVRLLPIVGSLNKQLIRLKTNAKSIDTLSELLALVREPGQSPCGQIFAELHQAICFTEVTFSYPGRSEAPVLQEVTVSFPKGRMTAIVGPSGAGKSTMVDLIARLAVPSRGSITVDGTNLQDYDVVSWRRTIGYVSQDTFLFSTTVRENIAFASPDASHDDVVWAAQQADAHEFIMALPKGYDALIGDRGLKLSSGQRQRIAIARAILRRPQILIFDEATSSLDNESEERVQRAIQRVSRDRTVIIVAHRLSTVIGANQIIVLGGGRIVEQGTHDALMVRGGLYWKLYHADGLGVPRQTGEPMKEPQLA